jgi:hypothetical protein
MPAAVPIIAVFIKFSSGTSTNIAVLWSYVGGFAFISHVHENYERKPTASAVGGIESSLIFLSFVIIY